MRVQRNLALCLIFALSVLSFCSADTSSTPILSCYRCHHGAKSITPFLPSSCLLGCADVRPSPGIETVTYTFTTLCSQCYLSDVTSSKGFDPRICVAGCLIPEIKSADGIQLHPDQANQAKVCHSCAPDSAFAWFKFPVSQCQRGGCRDFTLIPVEVAGPANYDGYHGQDGGLVKTFSPKLFVDASMVWTPTMIALSGLKGFLDIMGQLPAELKVESIGHEGLMEVVDHGDTKDMIGGASDEEDHDGQKEGSEFEVESTGHEVLKLEVADHGNKQDVIGGASDGGTDGSKEGSM